jgi:hypothetical protein
MKLSSVILLFFILELVAAAKVSQRKNVRVVRVSMHFAICQPFSSTASLPKSNAPHQEKLAEIYRVV